MDLALAIAQFNPLAEYRLNDAKTAIIEWRGPGPQPSAAQLTAAWAAYQASQIVFQAAQSISAKLRTANAAPTEILRRTLAQTTGYRAHLTLIAVDAGNGNLRSIEAAIVAKRLNAGALLVGTTVVLANHSDAGAAGWTITPSVSGNDFVCTVAGAAGRNIDWQLSGEVFRFAPAGLTD